MDFEFISLLLLKIYGALFLMIFIMVLMEFIDFESIRTWTRKSLTTRNDLEANKKNIGDFKFNKVDLYCNKFYKNDLPYRQHAEGYHYVRDRLKQLERTMEEWGIEDISQEAKIE